MTGASLAMSFNCCTSASIDEVVAALLDVADDLADRGAAGAVESLERGVELRGNRDQRPHLAAGDHPERADRVRIGRVRHCEGELPLVLFKGSARASRRKRAEMRSSRIGNSG